MESQPQNPEFRINPGNFYPCISKSGEKKILPNTPTIGNELINNVYLQICYV